MHTWLSFSQHSSSSGNILQRVSTQSNGVTWVWTIQGWFLGLWKYIDESKNSLWTKSSVPLPQTFLWEIPLLSLVFLCLPWVWPAPSLWSRFQSPFWENGQIIWNNVVCLIIGKREWNKYLICQNFGHSTILDGLVSAFPQVLNWSFGRGNLVKLLNVERYVCFPLTVLENYPPPTFAFVSPGKVTCPASLTLRQKQFGPTGDRIWETLHTIVLVFNRLLEQMWGERYVSNLALDFVKGVAVIRWHVQNGALCVLLFLFSPFLASNVTHRVSIKIWLRLLRRENVMTHHSSFLWRGRYFL